MATSRSAALAAAITLLAWALACATAHAAGLVQIAGPGGTQTVDLAQLTPDVNHTYTLIATPGGPPGTVTVRNGYSLPMILRQLSSSTPSFQSVEIPAPQGPPVVLSNSQATLPGAYSLAGPPVVWEDAAGAHFLVPSAAGDSLTGAGETFAGPAITIKLHQGPALAIGISNLGAFVNRPVQFNSTVGGAPSGPLLYHWSFGDGTTGSQPAPSHIYTATGTYNVYLQVTGSEDSVGASSVIHVVVGTPPPRTSSAGAGGAGTGNGSAGTGTPGSGTGNGSGGGSRATTPARRAPAKRPARHRPPQAPRPAGPLVSGIAISYGTQPAGAGAGGGAAAARQAHLRANAMGLREGMWIWFGVLAVLFAGGLLELRGPWRRSPAMAEAP
jgi:hypothetical protein